ncbi:hypothetical protein [Desulforamulus aquiferis]|uniref:Uncharacterized protein n=1 Tax=Desulforamulus aquiferis TaxID=1397668 RepID=A0AAW7ZH80_9FIRM|nr:hypothetical protein [Desulforamulus aquiferis]MDO7788810.1 hypothetical protein [Desulforamulus aquiferis]
MLKLNAALLNLQQALEECGIGKAEVVINCHQMTPVQCITVARDIAISGFGKRMIEEDKIHRYSHRKGGFSWVQLEAEEAKINLFYNLKHC